MWIISLFKTFTAVQAEQMREVAACDPWVGVGLQGPRVWSGQGE